MPAEFNTDVARTHDAEMTLIRELFANPTGWGTRIKDRLSHIIDTLGSASERDVSLDGVGVAISRGDRGVAANVALADGVRKGFAEIDISGGLISAARAKTIVDGIPDIIGSIRGIRVPRQRLVRSITPNSWIFNNRTILPRTISQLVVSDQPSLLLIASDGGGATYNSGRSPSSYAGPTITLMADSNYDMQTKALFINGGGARVWVQPEPMLQNVPQSLLSVFDFVRDSVSLQRFREEQGQLDNFPRLYENRSDYPLTDSQLSAFGFRFARIYRGWGAKGGGRARLTAFDNEGNRSRTPARGHIFPPSPERGVTVPRPAAVTNHRRTDGTNGDLLVAFKPGRSSIFFEGILNRPQTPRRYEFGTEGASGYALEILL